MKSRVRKTGHQALRLCSQVERALGVVFMGGFASRVLQDLVVVAVEPAPNSSRLMVTVAPTDLEAPVDLVEIVHHLDLVSGLLRSEIAGAIHRKRVPSLVFRVKVEE